MDRSGKYHTLDGVMISPNLRVFGYDMKWGNVSPENWRMMVGVIDKNDTLNHPGSKHFDGWYWVIWDDGSRSIADGSRMTTRTSLSTDPTPNRVIDKDGNVECNTCLSVSMGTCMDHDCKCHHS